MTATLSPTGPASVAPAYRAPSFADVVHSEWTKARTVPSTLWTLLAATVIGIGLGALVSALTAHHYANSALSNKLTWDPTSISESGFVIAQLAIGLLGILLITSEYSTGAIGSSLAAVPRRGRLLAAKAVVLFALIFVVSEIITFASFFIGQALISGHAPTANLGDTHVLRALIGSGLCGAVLALMGLALGTLIRHAAGAIAVLVAILFILPAIAAALPTSIEHTVEKYWPTEAGGQVTLVVRTAHTLSPWAGLGVFCLFVAGLFAMAFARLNRRAA
jgi:ABC-2 type transport system permease protein